MIVSRVLTGAENLEQSEKNAQATTREVDRPLNGGRFTLPASLLQKVHGTA
jgi:hypothetical protein